MVTPPNNENLIDVQYECIYRVSMKISYSVNVTVTVCYNFTVIMLLLVLI